MSKNVCSLWFLVFGIWSITIGVSGQVRLTQIEKDSIQWRVPVAHRVVPGQSGYFLKYMTVPLLFDSLGIEMHDSIYVRNDSILLRDGQGRVAMKAGFGLDLVSAGDSIKYTVDSNEVATLFDIQNIGSGVATRAAFWSAPGTLSSDAAFYWDNTNKRLGIGTASPTYKLDVSGTQNTVGIRAGSNTAGDILYYGTGTVTGDITLFESNMNVSGTIGQEIKNSNTSSGSSKINIQVPNASSGDPYVLYTTAGSQNWSHGIDNSDSDKFKIGPSVNPSSTDPSTGLVMTTDGKIGWGIASPNYKFQIQGTKNTVGLSIRSDTGGDILIYGIGIASGDMTFFESNFQASGTLKARLENGNTSTGNAKFEIQVPNASSGDPYMTFTTGGAQNWMIGIDNSDSDKFKISNTDNPSGGWERIVINTVGNIGIRQNNPIRTLDVNGEVRISDLVNDPATKLLGADNDGDVSSVNVGNGLTIDAGTLTVSANINGTQNRVAKFTSQYAVGDSRIYTLGDSLVGINQSNPQYHLDVTGKFRVTNRTGTAATGAGFTSDGQLIAYSLDTAEATPNTYLAAGTNINITGDGTSMNPYTINNSAPENTSVKDGVHIDFAKLSNDTITGSIITGSIGATELASTAVSAGTYNYATIVVDQDGRITSASSNTDASGITSIATTSPILGGPITSSGTISIQNAAADGSTKGAATFTSGDFNDNATGLISIDYTNGQAASGSTKGFLTSTDWTTFNNKINLTSLSATAPLSYNNSTGVFSITQSGAASNGYLSSTDWNTFNNKQDLFNGYQLYSYTKNGTHYATEATNGPSGTTYHTVLNTMISDGTQGFQLANANSTDLWFRNKAGASFGAWYKLASQSWVTSQNYMSTWGYRTQSGTGAGVISYVTDYTVVDFTNGTGITVGRASGTNNVTVTNTLPFNYLGVQANAGAVGTITNTGTLNLTGSGATTVIRSGSTFTINSTDTDTDAQTLSFSSPTLSISNGNSVTLPVLPSGTTRQTLRNNGSAWVASSLLENDATRIDINGWIAASRTTILGSRLLVNGYIQYDPTGNQATTVAGRDANGGLTGVTVGSGLSLSSGTLSNSGVTSITAGSGISVSGSTGAVTVTNSPIYGECNYQGPSGSISTWTALSFNMTAKANGMTTGSGGVTIPTSGRYKVEASVQGDFTANVLSGYSGLSMRVGFSGGLKYQRHERVQHSNSAAMNLTLNHTYIEDLTAGQVIGIEVQQNTNSGSTLTIGSANVIVTKLF